MSAAVRIPTLPKALAAVVTVITHRDRGAGVACAELRRALGIPRTALRQRLFRLAALGLIEGIGATTARRYRLARQQETRVSAGKVLDLAGPSRPRRHRKRRRCLGPCGKMFESDHNGHRICDMCQGRVEKRAANLIEAYGAIG